MTPNDRLRAASGEIQFSDPMVSFLYEILRDHLPVGVVEKIVRDSETHIVTEYTNGWLARIAADMASRLR